MLSPEDWMRLKQGSYPNSFTDIDSLVHLRNGDLVRRKDVIASCSRSDMRKRLCHSPRPSASDSEI